MKSHTFRSLREEFSNAAANVEERDKVKEKILLKKIRKCVTHCDLLFQVKDNILGCSHSERV